jgi:hypothetical protein
MKKTFKQLHNQSKMNNLLYSLLLIIIPLSSGYIRAQENKETLMKGIAYRQLEGEGKECTDIDKLNVSWYYNWTPAPNCPSGTGIEFIPMIWSEKYLFDENYKKYLLPLIGSDYPALLGYNEPNWDGQAEMSVKTALRYWPMLEKTGLRLGSPATTGRSGLDWTIEFMKGVKEKGYRLDFLALHWYGNCSCTDYLKDFLDYYDAWGMPMWLTEWSCYKQDMKTNTDFLKKAIPLLNSYENMERYAWYSNRTTSESYRGAALFDSTGTATPTGEIYLDYPAIHEKKAEPAAIPDIELEIVDFHEDPVLSKNNPGTEDIRHGFEGGRVIKHRGVYHLFTSEQSGDPKWVKMRLGHWKSSDGINWERVSTLMESSGDYTGEDPRAAIWSPMPVFNDEDSTWYMTYVAYMCKPDTREQFLNNFDGRIWQAKSKIRGYDGLGGPYEDIGIIMEPGALADDWEGLQGTDSFFPFRSGNKWLAFMGSAKTEKLPITFWGNGLALAPALTGPWIRLSARNPVDFGVNFTENPIVTRLDDGLFIAIMDSHGEGFGYSVSPDGIYWSKLKTLNVTDKMTSWWFEFRTPLSLIREDDGTYTVFFTVMKEETDYWQHIGEEGYILDTGFDSMGKLSVRIITSP